MGCALGFVGVLLGFWVNRGVPLGPSGSAWVIGFTVELPRVRRIHSGSLRSLGCAVGVVRFNPGH